MIIVYGKVDYRTSALCACGGYVVAPFMNTARRNRVHFKCTNCGRIRRNLGQVQPWEK